TGRACGGLYHSIVRHRTLLLAFSFLFVFQAQAVRQRAVPHPVTPPLTQAPANVFTFSNTDEVTTTHLALDLTVDFAQHRLRGSATLTLDNPTGTNRLVLDTRQLATSRVLLDGTQQVTGTIGPPTQHGSRFTIPITPATHTVTIEYTTASDASGLFWNSAAQSFGRQQPYLYSLNEPIDARSWIPIQDTPSMRLTYEATLHVPPGMLALMSAENPTETNTSGVYTFRMNETVPPYLIALAVGRLEFHAFDERTGVYAEPELMPDAIEELAYLPELLDAAEEIAGPHPFPRHDVLLMPPTFVVGGMEHPRLNFINPSVVTGNHPDPLVPSLLIAHELGHSWSGDATTTGSWDDVWLNEGFASYLAIRFVEALGGPARAEHQLSVDRTAFEGLVRFSTDPSDTLLHRPLTQQQNPGIAFNSASYTKGELFLRTLEDSLGRPAFDAILQAYFRRFAFHWVDERNFLAFLREQALPSDVEQRLRVVEWIYAPNLPSNVSAPASSAIARQVQAQVQRFTAGTSFANLDRAGWTDTHLDLFLQQAPAANRLAEIDAVLHLSTRPLPPLRWLVLGIFGGYQPVYAGVERVLLRAGTNGAVLTLYNTLITAGDRSRAAAIFAVARDRYHPGVRAEIERMLAESAALQHAA
ncbi:MAG: leukotriene-A4 hydrolase, partial [Acidobacteriota bacterium]|nr:leukotriene-A4 hydrolase [Acidobacteriota bacterium]